MEDDMQRFANLLADLITKYIDRLDLDSLPDPPPRPTANDAVGVFLCIDIFSLVAAINY